MQGCGGFHNFVHVPQLRALDLEHFFFGQAAEFHLGMCLAKLVHLQASYLTALQGIEHAGLILSLSLCHESRCTCCTAIHTHDTKIVSLRQATLQGVNYFEHKAGYSDHC